MGHRTPQDALQVLHDAAEGEVLTPICEAHRVGLLVAFGSAARDEPAPVDLDLAYARRDAARVDVLGLLAALVDLTRMDRIDLLDIDRAGTVAAARALGKCIPLYESTPGRFATEQLRAVMRFADTQWLRRAQLRALAGR
ncbi:MAG: nucleotidyltransferase domain-containing protein [Euzebyaceae bacterium]|jgi:predicted nucleotidyltransferase|nr:nucleotidyltransferase domain-containing protein [Euzebyaceae bacterium]